MHRPAPIAIGLAWLMAAIPAACASAGPPAPPGDLLDFEIDQPRIASRIRVIGQVTDSEDDPVAGAVAFVQAYTWGRCQGGRAAEARVATRNDGWFIKTLYFYSRPSTPTCVTVTVTPPAGSALAPDSVGGLMSEFRHGRDIDTVLVRFRLNR